MATSVEIAANCRNTQKGVSPGAAPRSAEDKSGSGRTAWKPAASAKSLVIPGEEESALAELAAAYHQQFQSVGPEELLLLEKIVHVDWMQRRMACLEAQDLSSLVRHRMIPSRTPSAPRSCRIAKAPTRFRRSSAAARPPAASGFGHSRRYASARPAASLPLHPRTPPLAQLPPPNRFLFPNRSSRFALPATS